MKEMDFYGLEGKSVLITGSSRGIGAATARLFHEYGANVVLHGRTESKQLRDLAKELNSDYIVCDVKDKETVSHAVHNSVHPFSILINNAGINISKPYEQFCEDDWMDVYSTNVFGVNNFTRAVIPGMKELGLGKIVNIASIKGLPSKAGSSAYASSKAAVINFTASLANQYAPNINVNCVSPGFTKTEMTESTWTDRIERQVDSIPMQRMAESREIAEVIVFLASNKAKYITGQNLVVDGGLSIKS